MDRTPHTTVELPVEDFEQPNPNGKTVARAAVAFYETLHPELEKQVVTVETRDGATYRFQRFADDEALVWLDRRNPNGERFERKATVPENVEAIRVAIREGEIAPSDTAREYAEQREQAAVAVARSDALATDGGEVEVEVEDDRFRETGDCAHFFEQRADGSYACLNCPEVIR